MAHNDATIIEAAVDEATAWAREHGIPQTVLDIRHVSESWEWLTHKGDAAAPLVRLRLVGYTDAMLDAVQQTL